MYPTDQYLAGYTWVSKTPYWDYTDDNASKLQGDFSQWSGKIVLDTWVKCTVRVKNPYAPDNIFLTQVDSAEVHVLPTPRPSWTTELPALESDSDAEWQTAPTTYPQLFGFPGAVEGNEFEALGQNTNLMAAYRNYSGVFFVPKYNSNNDLKAQYAASIAQLVSDGPNLSLWYNRSKPYTYARISRFNSWVKPGAGKPTRQQFNNIFTDAEYQVFSVHPIGGNWANWLGLQATVHGDNCSCTNSAHDVPNVRWIANKAHEEHGSYQNSPYGHENRQIYRISLPQRDADANFQSESQVAESLNSLRDSTEYLSSAADNFVQDASKLLDLTVLTPDPNSHNFTGPLTTFQYNVKNWRVDTRQM
ncbi:MAG: hypothetical protein WC655_09660 [Candidatus Hydrogenedentales bacterium]